MTVVTHDTISLRDAGVVHIAQPKKGARFTLDSLLLADFCRIKPRDVVLEPGTGTGIVSILLAKKFPDIVLTSIEIQPSLAELCRNNVTQNGLESRIRTVELDIKQMKRVLKPLSFDALVANPPYTKRGTGKQSPHEARQFSRHDNLATIDDWLDLHVFLKDKARFVLIYPAEKLPDLIAGLRSRSLEPKRMRLVHPYRDKSASLVLIEAIKDAGIGLEVLPPLVVHETHDSYSEEMRQIYDLP
jgi:tRNA1Val (adenine37-N6)-methyltransferase